MHTPAALALRANRFQEPFVQTSQMEPDDAAAVARAKGGDEDAFRLIVERHGRSVYRLAYRMTGCPEDAEDVAQETFVRAYRQLARFEGRSGVATWLYRIAVNCAIDCLRARPRHEVPESPETLERMAGEAQQRSMEEVLYAKRVARQVEETLGVLTVLERAAFVLRHYQGCSIEEVAGVLGLRPSAAKHAIFRAVRKMRAALRPLADAPQPADPVPARPQGAHVCPVKP